MTVSQCFEAEGQELGLRSFGVAGEFACDMEGCAAWDEVEDCGGDEFISENYGGGEDCAVGG